MLDYQKKSAEHGEENGVIIIYSKPDEDMSNTDTLRFLGKVFGINPGPYKHLNSSN